MINNCVPSSTIFISALSVPAQTGKIREEKGQEWRSGIIRDVMIIQRYGPSSYDEGEINAGYKQGGALAAEKSLFRSRKMCKMVKTFNNNKRATEAEACMEA